MGEGSQREERENEDVFLLKMHRWIRAGGWVAVGELVQLLVFRTFIFLCTERLFTMPEDDQAMVPIKRVEKPQNNWAWIIKRPEGVICDSAGDTL